MKRDFPIVEVEWLDSSIWSGWDETESRMEHVRAWDLVCRSVGYLVKKTKDRVILCFGFGYENQHVTLAIPRQAVVKITPLVEKGV